MEDYNIEEDYVNTTIEYVKSLEDSNKQLTEQVNNINKDYLYLKADFVNQKKQYDNKIVQMKTMAAANTIKSILPIIDDLDRAINASGDSIDKEGIINICKKFVSILNQQNVEKINPEHGSAFNVDVMEAVATVQAETEELKNTVHACILTGYKIDDNVLRYAKVVVNQ